VGAGALSLSLSLSLTHTHTHTHNRGGRHGEAVCPPLRVSHPDSAVRRIVENLIKIKDVPLGETTWEKLVNFAVKYIGSSPRQFISPRSKACGL
jgi:hypothetical protein